MDKIAKQLLAKRSSGDSPLVEAASSSSSSNYSSSDDEVEIEEQSLASGANQPPVGAGSSSSSNYSSSDDEVEGSDLERRASDSSKRRVSDSDVRLKRIGERQPAVVQIDMQGTVFHPLCMP